MVSYMTLYVFLLLFVCRVFVGFNLQLFIVQV